MLEEVVLGLEEFFGLPGFQVKLDPLLVDTLRDSVGMDASLLEPSVNGIDTVLGRCEYLVYLFGSVMFAIVWGCRVRADIYIRLVSSLQRAYIDLHIIEVLVAAIKVALRQTNAYR